MKLQTIITMFAAGAGMAMPGAASATEVRFRVTAHVATACEMRFSADVRELSDSEFALGTLDQFCNVPFQMNLVHSADVDQGFVGFHGRKMALDSRDVLLEANGNPVNGSALLTAHGINAAQAGRLAGTAVLIVTPKSF